MYGTSWKKLAEFNSLSNPHKLLVGQEIQIPGSLNASAPVVRLPGSSAASVSASESPIKQGSSYVIQRGDTLSGIAKRAGLSVQEIQAANALDSHVIIAGKSLSIPKKGEISVPSVTKAVESVPVPEVEEELELELEPAPAPAPIADIAPLEPAASAPVYEHVLYPGETLEDVARQYGSSKDEIMMLNGISSPDAVKPGTKLLVPIPE
jgi:LysM repeat protein